jgi:glutathione S-transferase
MVEAGKQTLTVGYWKIRGLQSPIRYILEYLVVPYKEDVYEQGDAPEYSRECWMSVKPNLGLDFPNLPYLIDGDVKITESHAIIRYIANKYGGTDFSGKNPKDKATVDMILGVVSDIKSAATSHCYGSGDMEAVKKIGLERMEAVSKFLGSNNFFAGDYVTFVDFFIFEQIELFAWATKNELLTRYPNLAEFHKRVIALPKFSEYYNSDRFMKSPFNNKIAKLNN